MKEENIVDTLNAALELLPREKNETGHNWILCLSRLQLLSFMECMALYRTFFSK